MKLRKVVVMALFAIGLLPLLASAAFAADDAAPIDVMVNDTFITLEARPYFVEDTVYVPVRSVLNAFGVNQLGWDAETSTLTVDTPAARFCVTEGRTEGVIDGQPTAVGGTLQVVGEKAFLPARFMAKALGAQVLWDDSYLIVKFFKDGVAVPQSCVSVAYSMDDLYWLSQIVSAESKGEPVKGQIAVANVILNRVRSPLFPNNIYDVVFDREFGVQFSPIADGSIYNTATRQSILSAKRALNGENYAGNSLYFLNPAIAQSSWAAQNRCYYTTIQNHAFYL